MISFLLLLIHIKVIEINNSDKRNATYIESKLYEATQSQNLYAKDTINYFKVILSFKMMKFGLNLSIFRERKQTMMIK